MEPEHALALIHVGMILGSFTDWEDLPLNLLECDKLMMREFEIDIWKQSNILEVRDKLVALTENRGVLN